MPTTGTAVAEPERESSQEHTGGPTQSTTAADAPAENQQLVRSSAAAMIGFGLSPKNWDEGLKIAGKLATSALVPKAFQGHPEDIVVAMQMGAEIGLAPMQALQSIAVINGKPGVYGDGFLAVIKGSPLCVGHAEWWEVGGGRKARIAAADLTEDDTTAVCAFWRRGHQEPYINSFSVGEAKKAGLWGKGGNWATYPQRMLMWRARSWAGRDGFPDLLRGIGMAEELQDITTDVIDVEAVRPGLPTEPVRRSEKSQGTDTAAAAQAAGDALTTELPQEPAPPATEKRTTTATKSSGRSSTAAAAQTRQQPDSKSQAGNGPSVTTESMVITETAYVAPPGQDPFWEVKATVRKEGAAPVAMIFVTREEALFRTAATCEGSETRLNLRWHGGKRQDGSACKVLEAVEAVN